MVTIETESKTIILFREDVYQGSRHMKIDGDMIISFTDFEWSIPNYVENFLLSGYKIISFIDSDQKRDKI